MTIFVTFPQPPFPAVFRPIPQPLYSQHITDILELVYGLARYLLYILLVGFAHLYTGGTVFYPQTLLLLFETPVDGPPAQETHILHLSPARPAAPLLSHNNVR